MESRKLEVTVGLFVIFGLVALLMLAMKVSNLSELGGGGGYEIRARFDNIGGLKVRSSVSMAGVKVGRISAITFDSNTYEAVVTMDIDKQHDRIPADSTASIFTAGLLGEQYIGLDAGGEEKYLAPGDAITLTQSAVILEKLIGQFLYNQVSKGS
ncbi:MAG: phospholipid/cholesterol/gamma-HCH transport system substrate-binding protein [Gammaproteobacteria bacterium]|jgi:phospholipid/cholesterol/gamma-HCH transport system substrate-binding protein